ncbi:MAG TPA: DNA recombination protein RmuC, partial [Sphingomicrobium sp.]|nr:DNA recombination protein RmuC [Sphingomicrobium sp.]
GGLTTAVNNYNAFVSSFESRSLVTARKFRDLNIEPGARDIEPVVPVEALPRYGDSAGEEPALLGGTQSGEDGPKIAAE